MRYVMAALGLLTLTSSVLLVLVALVIRQIPPAVEAAVYCSVFLICLGLVTMIVDLHTTKLHTDTEKSAWRGCLWWGGPFVAGWYLLVSARRARPWQT